jgi:hypothetical protein
MEILFCLSKRIGKRTMIKINRLWFCFGAEFWQFGVGDNRLVGWVQDLYYVTCIKHE